MAVGWRWGGGLSSSQVLTPLLLVGCNDINPTLLLPHCQLSVPTNFPAQDTMDNLKDIFSPLFICRVSTLGVVISEIVLIMTGSKAIECH